ncbi:sporulation protein [Streptomyces cavernicola]|uniref:Sporulation protein n=1 Tax=Streptomyces cavernicola TaxID=3043613 RepID=A0ABT6SAZ3_9ACTN|nr:sporulation protein [Streptomyces sp. B-S-A6]MDI3404959.1 sporulation protein [Streptomyces sp. B-S-A6]
MSTPLTGAEAKRGARPENLRLEALIGECGISRKGFAHRLNQLCTERGVHSDYTHTSVANWCRRGMRPRWPVPDLICVVLAERLGRPVGLADIGMEGCGRLRRSGNAGGEDLDAGLRFPREQPQALSEMTTYWSTLNRRNFLAATPFAASAFSEPVTRWLVSPAEPASGGLPAAGAMAAEPVLAPGGRLPVGRAHIEELREVADSARRWDSRFGGAATKSRSITAYLDERVSPLLRGRYTDAIGRELFSVTSQMARLAGWTAFDAGEHQAAQRHYIQALRLARAAGDEGLGAYILTTMAMQALMRGFASQAIDMAQGAYERVPDADPRVRGFAKLIEARAHARSGDARSASGCLARSEHLQEQAEDGGGRGSDLAWIEFFNRQRIVTDAVELFRDLGNPRAVFAWQAQGAMPGDAFARSRGIRLSMLASAHAQRGDLDQSLRLGRESLGLFTRLQSARGVDYLRLYSRSLQRWQREPAVVAYLGDVRKLGRTLTTAA